MIISRLELKNWRNFRKVKADLRNRVFFVGPNASGKSNLLDAFRFLRDVARTEGGGLQKAVRDRGGIPKLRCLAARTDPEVRIEVDIAEGPDEKALWTYEIGIKQQVRGDRLPIVSAERVLHKGKEVFSRPDSEDDADPARLTQTYLEQINANQDFRDVAKFFQSITYLHLVPQLLRFAETFSNTRVEGDPFGQSFLELVAKTPEKTQARRLRTIQSALKVAVPQLDQLRFARDSASGKPHLEAQYQHWRPNAGWQREDQFSDGTLRLIGLLWTLMDRDSLLLMEEPELSLNPAIVKRLPQLIYRSQGKRQVIITTHSPDLLDNRGIDPREVLLLKPQAEGTEVVQVSTVKEIKALLSGGLSLGEIIMPMTQPKQIDMFSLAE